MSLLPVEEWDFSSLVVSTEKKGQKKRGKGTRVQAAALDWEMKRERGRANGSMQTAWLNLTDSQQQASIRPDIPRAAAVREISLIEFSKFIQDFDSKGATKSQGMLRRLADLDWKSANPVSEDETPHVLLISWKDCGKEQLKAELMRWARSWTEKMGARKKRAEDSMSDLWELAAYRLNKIGQHPYNEVASMLNGLPAFRTKRGSFDADCARKAASAAKAKIDSANTFTRNLRLSWASQINRKPSKAEISHGDMLIEALRAFSANSSFSTKSSDTNRRPQSHRKK